MMVTRLNRWRFSLAFALVVTAVSWVMPLAAGQTGFDNILASSDKRTLTEWGRRYEHGEGVRKSADRAIRLYCKAAKAGHAEAQYYLGYIYAHGRGVKRNDALAARSHKNAQGLMQLIPATARRFGVKDVWDPEQNLRGGMSYLRWLLDHFEGDVKLALAGYNAGEEAVRRYRGIPPYAETRAYVERISQRLNL
jgi:hypothetical protein